MTAPFDINLVVSNDSVDDLVERLGQGLGPTAMVRHAAAISYDAAFGNRMLVEATRNHAHLLRSFVLGPLDAGEHGELDSLNRRLETDGVAAIWLYPAAHGWDPGGPEAATLLEFLGGQARPVFVEQDQLDWRRLSQLAERLGSVPLVVCGVGYRTLRQVLSALDRHPNLHLDTSLSTAQDGLEHLVERFGASRFAYGSGAPRFDVSASRFRLSLAGLDDEAKHLVARGNAARLLGFATGSTSAKFEWAAARRDVELIDAHTHIGRWPSSWLPQSAPEDLIRMMDLTGTSIALTSSMEALWSDVARGNAATVQAAEKSQGRILAMAVAPPDRQQMAAIVDLLGHPLVRGLKVHPHTHERAVDDARYDWVWEIASKSNTPVLVHTFAGTWHSDPRLVARVATRYPDVPILMGHSGATPDGFEQALSLAREYPNLYLELCGSLMTGSWISRLVREAGADRVVHGTDSTLIDQRYGVGRLLGAELTPAELAAVAGGNAKRLFNIN